MQIIILYKCTDIQEKEDLDICPPNLFSELVIYRKNYLIYLLLIETEDEVHFF